MDGQLMDACETLLGTRATRGGTSALDGLDVSLVRSAFRTLALETHPDAAACRDPIRRAGDGARFIKVSQAYEVLMGYLLSRPPTPAAAAIHTRPTDRARPYRRPTTDGRRSGGYWCRGPVPRHRLRLAEFLFYTGRISWQSLIRAVVWQRAGRPRFGELARRSGCMTRDDLVRVLLSRARNERTGEAASRLHVLNAEAVTAVLRRQHSLQKRIGAYFLESGHMTRPELVQCLRELSLHNARCRQKSAAAG